METITFKIFKECKCIKKTVIKRIIDDSESSSDDFDDSDEE